jgi:hypothetical protein
MQKAIVSHDKTKMAKMVRRRKLHCVRRSRLLHKVARCSWCGNIDGKKSDEEAKKKKRIGLTWK